MTIVSNTSPLIALSTIGKIELLHELYDSIFIPQAVYSEITRDNLPGCNEIKTLSWITKKDIKNRSEVTSLSFELDPGETEAIALALELHADLLLIDERKGKVIADRLGINNIGVLGVLIDAKNHKIINAVKPLLDDLIVKAGFWFDRTLYNRVLEITGEK